MFTLQASVDIEEAHRWYEERRPGLGDEFRAAVAAVCHLLTRFPYAMYYRITEHGLEVRACLHQHSDPNATIRPT